MGLWKVLNFKVFLGFLTIFDVLWCPLLVKSFKSKLKTRQQKFLERCPPEKKYPWIVLKLLRLFYFYFLLFQFFFSCSFKNFRGRGVFCEGGPEDARPKMWGTCKSRIPHKTHKTRQANVNREIGYYGNRGRARGHQNP